MPSPSRHGVNTGSVDDFRRRQLESFGVRVRQLRVAAGLTGGQVAARARVTQPTISKVENGRIMPSADVVGRIAAALGLPDEVREDLLEELTRINTDIATWRRAGGRGEAKQQMIGQRDRAATLRRSYHPAIVPGLLQTAEYSRAVFSRSMFLDEDERARAVAARLERQTVLYSDDRRFELIIGEAALRTRLGPASLMLAQVDRIRLVASLDNVRIGILPLLAEPPRVAPNGFALYDDDRVVIETYTSEIALTDERDLDAYGRLFDDLSSAAVFGDDAGALLSVISQDLRRS
jgi:transcriptional regulator with XRE-family HTH domain